MSDDRWPAARRSPPLAPGGLEAVLAWALFRREWRAASLGTAGAALAVAGAALGRLLASHGLLPDPSNASTVPIASIASLQDFALWLLSRALPLPIAVMACVVAIDRMAGDGDAPWLATLAAAGLNRGGYVVVAATAVASSQLALYAALAAGYVAGAAALGGEGAALTLHLLRGLPGVAALLASTTLYGAVCVALARRRGPALALALAGVMVPLAVLGWLGVDGIQSASPAALRLLTVAMPPPAWTSSAEALQRHALYCAVLVLLLTRSAPRWVARHG